MDALVGKAHRAAAARPRFHWADVLRLGGCSAAVAIAATLLATPPFERFDTPYTATHGIAVAAQ